MEALASNSLYEAKTQSSRMLFERTSPVESRTVRRRALRVATISLGEAAERLGG
jgi:hypothetical protein